MSSKRKEITIQRRGYMTIWRHGPNREPTVEVDVYKGEELVLEWSELKRAEHASS